MFDSVQKIRGSLVQHGEQNDRIYLMKLAPEDVPAILDDLDVLARRRGFGKIFAKVPARLAARFLRRGYRQEAAVPGFYRGREEGTFLALYPDPERARERRPGKVAEILRLAREKAAGRRAARAAVAVAGTAAASPAGAPALPPAAAPAPEDGFQLAECGPADAEAMSEVYRQVFATYPFPIHDPDYLRRTMATHIRYFGARREGRLLALASSEMDAENLNVEMTDFATLPAARGHGLAVRLLRLMEREMAAQGMRTAYTIARSLSAGMNVTFAKLGYRHGGTLVNNTNISGDIESMNVWWRTLGVSG